MPSVREIVNRLCLRLTRGHDCWHQRYYRPEVHVVDGTEHLWFEQAGIVVEAYPLAMLQGRFQGRCNLLLSGPSVKQIHEPRRLARNDWIGVNGSPALFGEDIPRMRIYHVNDTTFIRGALERFLRFAANADFTVIDFRSMYELLRLAPDAIPDTRLVVYDSWNYPHRLPLGKIEELSAAPEHRGVHWSHDPRLGLATGGTVAYTASQIAWLGGYSSLYIYGLDLTATGRFYEEKDPQPQMLDKAFNNVIVPAFELLARQTANQLTVYNCNPASRLPSDIVPTMDSERSLST